MTDKTFEDTVNNLVKEFVYSNINLTIPARVVSVSQYQSKQQIDVQPLINYFDDDNEAIQLPVIYAVTVCLTEGGGALISVPIKVGDKVKLEFSKQGLDTYLESDGTTPLTPNDKRKFAITDCFATAGCPTTSTTLKPNPTDVEIKFANSSWKMKPTGNVQLDVSGDYIENISGNKIVNIGGNETYNAVNKVATLSGTQETTATSITQTAPSIALDATSLSQTGTGIGKDHVHSQGNDSAGDSQVNTNGVVP